MSGFKIKLDHPMCKPAIGSELAAGMDLRIFLGPRADAAVEIHPGATVMLDTGVSIELPPGWVGLIAPRSSTGKLQIQLENTLGVIDADYRGVIRARLYNFGTETQILYNFDRVMQMVVVPHANPAMFELVDELSETVRGNGGFGSSGRN